MRDDQHGMGEEILHIIKRHAICVGKIAGTTLCSVYKDQISNNRYFYLLFAVFQLTNHGFGGKIVGDV